METRPPDGAGTTIGEAEQTYCYGHPTTPTQLRCSRCDRPICGRCAIPASVGQHCPECVAEARRTAPKVRSAVAATAPATVAIVVLSVAFFLAQQFVPGLTQALGAYPPAIADGEWWRLVTPMLLHAPRFIFHILFNMLVLWMYGANVEQAFGTARFVAIYVISGFFAGATSYALGPCRVLGVGASGAIFGVVGVLLVYLYNRRRSSFVRGFLRNLLLFIGINFVLGLAIAGIDLWAHAGGLAAGIALGAGFDQNRESTNAVVQIMTALGVLFVGLLLVVWRTGAVSC